MLSLFHTTLLPLLVSSSKVWDFAREECAVSPITFIQDHGQLRSYTIAKGVVLEGSPDRLELFNRLRRQVPQTGILSLTPKRTPLLSLIDFKVTSSVASSILGSFIPSGFVPFDTDVAGWTITPAGAISPPHIDDSGMPAIIHHLSGRKLWLFWPATAENKIKWERHLEVVGRRDALCDALGGLLDGLQVLIVEEPGWFYIPPACIHCVITLTVSIHINVGVICPCDLQYAQDAAEWYARWTSKARRGEFLQDTGDKGRLAMLIRHCRENVNQLTDIAAKHHWHELNEWKSKTLSLLKQKTQ